MYKNEYNDVYNTPNFVAKLMIFKRFLTNGVPKNGFL